MSELNPPEPEGATKAAWDAVAAAFEAWRAQQSEKMQDALEDMDVLDQLLLWGNSQ